VRDFVTAQAQLDENRKRKRASLRGPRWLLQGLTVCRCCGYAYYVKTSALSPTDRAKGRRHYYRCIGADAHRFDGTSNGSNPTVRGDRPEQRLLIDRREPGGFKLCTHAIMPAGVAFPLSPLPLRAADLTCFIPLAGMGVSGEL